MVQHCKSHNTNFTLGCDENGQPQEISPADFNSSCPYSGPPSDAKLATFYDFHEIKPGGEEIRYEPGTELLFRCVDIGKEKVILKGRLCIYRFSLNSILH